MLWRKIRKTQTTRGRRQSVIPSTHSSIFRTQSINSRCQHRLIDKTSSNSPTSTLKILWFQPLNTENVLMSLESRLIFFTFMFNQNKALQRGKHLVYTLEDNAQHLPPIVWHITEAVVWITFNWHVNPEVTSARSRLLSVSVRLMSKSSLPLRWYCFILLKIIQKWQIHNNNRLTGQKGVGNGL